MLLKTLLAAGPVGRALLPVSGFLVFALAMTLVLLGGAAALAVRDWWERGRVGGTLPCYGCQDAPGTQMGLCSDCAAHRGPVGL